MSVINFASPSLPVTGVVSDWAETAAASIETAAASLLVENMVMMLLGRCEERSVIEVGRHVYARVFGESKGLKYQQSKGAKAGTLVTNAIFRGYLSEGERMKQKHK